MTTSRFISSLERALILILVVLLILDKTGMAELIFWQVILLACVYALILSRTLKKIIKKNFKKKKMRKKIVIM